MGCLLPGGWVSALGGCLLLGGVCFRGRVSAPKGGCLLPGVPGGDNPPPDTAVGGMHPTGLHSCYCYFSLKEQISHKNTLLTVRENEMNYLERLSSHAVCQEVSKFGTRGESEEPTAHSLQSTQARGPKARADIIRIPKEGYQWSQKRNDVLQFLLTKMRDC